MREIILKVIATEAEAKRMVQAARSAADQVVAESRNQARQVMARASEEARREVETILVAAETAAGCEKARRLNLALAGIEAQIRIDEPARQRIVEAVVSCVCGQGGLQEESP